MTDTGSGSAVVVDWAVAARALPGEPRSGDRHVLAPFPGGWLAAAIDGLGHGPEAAAAADLAAETLCGAPGDGLVSLVERCHRAVWGTRGVVMSLAALNSRHNTVTWLAVGNVEGILLRANSNAPRRKEFVLLRGGVVGYQLPSLSPSTLPLLPRDVLVLATDGINAAFAHELAPDGRPQAVADEILARFAREADDALVLVLRWRPEAHAR